MMIALIISKTTFFKLQNNFFIMIRNDYDYLLKFILIGDSSTLSEIIGVGKSCILTRLLEGKFKSQHEPTLGV